MPENPKVNNVGHPYNTKKLLTYTHKNTQKKQKKTHTHTHKYAPIAIIQTIKYKKYTMKVHNGK